MSPEIHNLIGKSEREVKDKLDELKVRHRTVTRDGQPYVVTCDWQPQRCNLVITNNIVNEIYLG